MRRTNNGMLVWVATAALIAAGLAVVGQTTTGAAGEKVIGKPELPQVRRIDLAICLDTSSSMRGLISSAKQKLWAVVSEIATARPRPVFRVALYEYGNSGRSSENGWVRKICGLTDDLDTVYGKLFELRTNGGTEYVARVVRAAVGELDWAPEPNALKIIFVAGNERATQDPKHKLQDVCKATISKGIIINTIHCGSDEVGRRSGWSDAAAWADGKYAFIDQDNGTVAVATPYDKELAELGASLNGTYVPYGSRGAAGRANQTAQDGNASSVSGVAAAERAAAKGTALYTNTGWDLVDAVKNNKVKLAEVKESDLPAAMRSMSPAERKKHLAAQAASRADIQKQIRRISEKRAAHVKEQMAKQGLSDTASLDHALRAAVREQAESKGFEFEGGTGK